MRQEENRPQLGICDVLSAPHKRTDDCTNWKPEGVASPVVETMPDWIPQAAAEIMYGEGKCPICCWPLAKSAEDGCVLGNCSERGGSEEVVDMRRVRREKWHGIIDI